MLVLAGFTAGCASWTKNEGMLFVGATSLALLIPVLWKGRDALRHFAAFLAGTALPLALVLWFKRVVATPSDIFGGRHYGEIGRQTPEPGAVPDSAV